MDESGPTDHFYWKGGTSQSTGSRGIRSRFCTWANPEGEQVGWGGSGKEERCH